MKRRTLMRLALSLLLAAALLTGCGASTKAESPMDAMANGSFGTEEELLNEPMGESAAPEAMEERGDGDLQQKPTKLIYRGNLDMETTAFDDAVESLQALVQRCGGYIETSSLRNYGSGYRSADYTVRVPADRYRTFFEEAGALCNVTWKNEETENVSRYYYDTEGRLQTQQTKLNRLRELLDQAENMEDIITIESAISDTEYQIDNLSGELRYYDDLVDYSTVTISLNEVYQLSNTEEPATGFGGRLTAGFSAGFTDFIRGAENFLVGLAYHWVTVLILSAAIVLAVRHVRKKRASGAPIFKRPRRNRKKEDRQDPEQ